MSTELYRKYIDIVNENSIPLDEEMLAEGRVAQALAAIGLAGLGILGQHQAISPSLLDIQQSPQLSQQYEKQVQQQLATNPDYQKALAKLSTLQSGQDQERTKQNMNYDMARAQENAINVIQSEAPTIYNAIVKAVKESAR
jgi:hypothetical protein